VGVAVRAVGVTAAIVLLAVAVGCGSSSPKGPAITPNSKGWWRDKVAYEIFVRSFADSNGDGIGDLDGVTAKLPLLNDGDAATQTDLGVDFLWLMPIHPATSYHGYDVTDFRAVSPELGTLADLDELVAAAHARGIKVILDMVLNHTSAQHPWFQASAAGPTNAKRDWYVWSPTNPNYPGPNGAPNAWSLGNGAYYYSAFNGGMPDLNLRNALVEQELVDSMRFWLARGIDGFRLDAVRYFYENGSASLRDQPENHAFLKRVRATLQADYPDALLVAEAWAEPEVSSTYFGDGNEVQLAFSFNLAFSILTSAASTNGSVAQLNETLRRFESALAGKDRGYEAPFVSNHDIGRAARGLRFAQGGTRVAAAALLAMPGTPFLYYGDEIGMQGGDSDPQKRSPMRWTPTGPVYGFTSKASTWCQDSLETDCGNAPAEAAGVDVETQQADPGSLWNLHRKLIALRHAQAPLARGEAARPALSGAGAGVFALVRTWEGKRVLFVANFASSASPGFDVTVTGTPAVLLEEGLSGDPTSGAGKVTVPGLAGRSFAFISLD